MIINAKDITMSYPKSKRIVLKDVNLSIDKGEFVVINGVSGSGKSTLLAILGGYLKPVKGNVIFRGKNIGYVPQGNIMLKKYNILENLIVPLNAQKGSSKEKVLIKKAHKHLQKLRIDDLSKNYPNELSGGELKRVSLARAMMLEADLILADEPTTGLDSESSKLINDYLKEYSNEGNTVIVATHDKICNGYASRIITL